ncbi:MAG TPA: thioredoxin domain-containing protein [Rhodanobacteraceae bacterium]|nr:thioredoxin domain-containing protein [Rhodanobacteraceae bacterium]
MPNHLATETSPYLRQHADNPVDWWPWCDEALSLARKAGKPILLSIGYSACHWCHVMARESFEDAATAALMNELYVCIKVDREERPDLDKVYQLAYQAMNRRGGGWPLTAFLTPDDHLPFYLGTYFPPTPRHGLPAFGQVLQEVRRWWDEQRGAVREQNRALAAFLADGAAAGASATPDDAPLRAVLATLADRFDPKQGGHRGAPKFPPSIELELLLDLEQPAPVALTLERMAAGGIHDQLGGGFARYSVDAYWQIPHFEKMLYDNAQLLPLYAEHDPAVAQRLIDWLRREMTAADGSFFAALDADSEHEEGKYYVWQREQVRDLLEPDEYAVIACHYGLDLAPNFENRAWNLVQARPLAPMAQALGIADDVVAARLARAREKLLAARSQRVRPGLDDKRLTGWNALMIAGLARASRTCARADWLTMAERALDALHAGAWRDGRLLAKTGPDATRFPAYLDDCACLLDALLEMLQCRWSARDFEWALALAEQLLARFEDSAQGGFFFTAHEHETLIQRSKPFIDEATPAGNGVAARALLRLGHLTGETRYLDAAERCLRAGRAALDEMPAACSTQLRALNDYLAPRSHVVIRCAGEAEAARWAASAPPARRTDVYRIPAAAGGLPGVLAAQVWRAGGVAYRCRGTQCEPPITDPARLHSEDRGTIRSMHDRASP